MSFRTFSVYPSQMLVIYGSPQLKILPCSNFFLSRCSMRHDVVPDACLHATVGVHLTVREKLLT